MHTAGQNTNIISKEEDRARVSYSDGSMYKAMRNTTGGTYHPNDFWIDGLGEDSSACRDIVDNLKEIYQMYARSS
jgi:hypothetical protein